MGTESEYPISSLEDELLQLVARQASRVPFPVFIGASIIAWFASAYLPTAAWAGWYLLALSMLLVRWLVYRRLPELSSITMQKRIRIVMVLNGLHGVTYGLSLVAFPHFAEIERSIHTILLMTMCVGSVSTTAGYRPILYVFLAPIIIPMSIMWAISPAHSGSNFPEYLAALLTIMFGGLLLGMASDAFKVFRESFEIRLQQIKLNQQLREAVDEAEAASRAKTRFLASASHDLRQPIHTLSLFGAALKMQPLNSESVTITEHMNTTLQVLASQLDTLLDISKLDANIVEVDKAAFNISALLKRLEQEMSGLAAEKGLQFRLECPGEYFVDTDKAKLEQILGNLVTNAIKYTQSGEVRVVASDYEGRLMITVADTGCGISDEELGHIFDEFYQVSNQERDRSKGFGLGLSIVKRLVDLVDIELHVESEPGVGSQFCLELPIVKSVDTDIEAEDTRDLDWSHLSVLVVDDEESVRLGMKTLLESLGCRVTATENVASSVNALRRQVPDVAMVDFRLRGDETGIQLIHALREIAPDLPAILISGDTAPARLREARDAGVTLLHKPVLPNVLRQAVIEVLDT